MIIYDALARHNEVVEKARQEAWRGSYACEHCGRWVHEDNRQKHNRIYAHDVRPEIAAMKALAKKFVLFPDGDDTSPDGGGQKQPAHVDDTLAA